MGLLHLFFVPCCVAFKTAPVKSNEFLPSNKFTKREALSPDAVDFGVDASGLQTDSDCPKSISLVWTNELDSSIYATPVVDRLGDGKRHILVPEFRNQLTLLDFDGHVVPGWPLPVTEEEVDFHTSPVVGDFNEDGYEDIVWISVNGEVFMVSGKDNTPSLILQIPKLKIRKNWFEENNDDNNQRGGGQPGGGRNLLQVLENGNELFGDEPPAERAQTKSAYVDVDVHVLATPVAVDVNNDGCPELIVALSYFFDRESYTNHPEHFAHIDADVDLEMYVAGGVICHDLRRNFTVWKEQLDLTTDLTSLRAHIYASPTVIDLDNDGDLEVVVGTSLGYIYVLSAHSGEMRSGFPIHMSEIQAQVTVEDVNGDGMLELIAADVMGNVLCFDRNGKEIWERQVAGFVTQGATFGDVNGDGDMDVVVGTLAGQVWALRGDNGLPLPNFPLRTDDRILAPITLVNLDTRADMKRTQLELLRQHLSQQPVDINYAFAASVRDVFPNVSKVKLSGSGFGLHLVFPSFDGHVYIVDGRSGCATKLDISEHAYGMVLADDILGNDKMQLLVSTQNGNVYCFATESPYHPMKSWISQAQGVNGFTARAHYHGIFIVQSPQDDVTGSSFDLTFDIVDERPKIKKHKQLGKYVVTIGLSGIDAAHTQRDALTHVTSRQLVFRRVYSAPGRYTERISVPRVPHSAVLHLHMRNEHAQYFQDSVEISFNTHYYRLLKYFVIGPLLASAAIFAVLQQSDKTQLLPSREHGA